MKKLVIGWLIVLHTSAAFGQKNSQKFILPAGAEYVPGAVLVKLKSSQKENFQTQTFIRSRGKNFSSRPLVNRNSNSLARAQSGPLRAAKSGLDMSLYHTVYVPKSENIEAVINDLYATGLFEIVEPVYREKMDYTPNDPQRSNQYYLDLINAYEAWDVSKGDEQTVIAIIDSGGDLDHPDLASKLYINQGEIAGNGIDDDGDLYVDNVSGWDFVGNDTLNIFDSEFIGDNNPQLFAGGVLSHGVWVGGCAGAATDNSTGMAGVGFQAKLMFTKHTADNQKTNDLSVFFGYSGILYAAETLTQDGVPRKIINCSWGGSGRSQIAQDIITYVTIDLGCLVVGAAGNEDSNSAHYPSGYDYVLSVAATNQSDVRASFSNYGTTVDLTAPGVSIFTTQYNNTYGTVQGTSFSCPIVAGAAALVWSHYPNFSPLQVAEQLRISSDASIYQKNSASFKNLLGKGRLDIQAALSVQLPSVRANNAQLKNASGSIVEPGQPGLLEIDFTNYLKSSSSALTVKAVSSTADITFQSSEITLGILGEGQTLKKSFPVTLASNVTENKFVDVTLTFTDGQYTDFQSVSFLINPSFINIDENKVITSVSSRGRIGFDDPSNQEDGAGFIFNDASILFEMGLIMGSSASTISNNVRGINSGFDQDFTFIDRIREINPGERSSAEVYGSFANASTLANASLHVKYRTLTWTDAPYDQFVIIEYTVKNNSASPINGFRFGIFADWDISSFGANDAAGWNAQKRVGFVYPKQSSELPHAGIQLLNHPANYFAIDNNQSIAGNPFGLYDGYTDQEKFNSLSTERLSSIEAPAGNDVSHVVSAAPVNLNAGQEVTIAFALHAANNLDELLLSAAQADTAYNFLLAAAVPAVVHPPVCYGQQATLTASGASAFKWYNTFTGGSPIAQGAVFQTGNLFSDTTFYVSNATNSYESVRTKVEIDLLANPAISASGSPFICPGDTLTLTALDEGSYTWNTGETSKSIKATQTNTYTVNISDASCNSIGSFDVEVLPAPGAPALELSRALSFCQGDTLFISSAPATTYLWSTGATSSSISVTTSGEYFLRILQDGFSCFSSSDTLSVDVKPAPQASFTTPQSFLIFGEVVNFTNTSTNDISWSWNFGDNTTSTDENPNHTYSELGSYTVTLVATAANGCQDTFTQELDIVLDAEGDLSTIINLHPNPIVESRLTITIENNTLEKEVILINALGTKVFTHTLAREIEREQLDFSHIPPGVYLAKIRIGSQQVVRKIIKTQ